MIEQCSPWAQDLTQQRGLGYKYLSQMQREINRKRSKVRARLEHAIGVIKRIFGFAKVRYRGLLKNGNRLFVAAALGNLSTVIHRQRAPTGWPAGTGAPAGAPNAPPRFQRTSFDTQSTSNPQLVDPLRERSVLDQSFP